MSDGKHTAGPWVIDEYMGGVGRNLPGCAIMCRDNNKVVCEIPDYTTGLHDKEDACLISAAPDLLEALIKCADQLEAITGMVHDERQALIAARAAIAKAVGE